MRKHIALFLIIAFLFSSCAIHRKFPFICFRKECVLGQLGFYKMKEAGKRMKINANVRRSKRAAKKRKSQSKGENIRIDVAEPKKDSLRYGGGKSAGICKETKLVIFQKTESCDTILIYFPLKERDITEDKKKELKDFVEKAGADVITEVIIKNCHNKNVLTEHELTWLNERARKITKYLKTLHIEKTKIKTEE
jgi:hypothetical protein